MLHPVLSVITCTVCYNIYCVLHLVLSVISCTVCYILYCVLLLVLSVISCTVCYILYCYRRLTMMVCLYNVTNVNVFTSRSAVSGHNPGLLKRGKVSTYYCVTGETFFIFNFRNTSGESGVSHLPYCKFGRCFLG